MRLLRILLIISLAVCQCVTVSAQSSSTTTHKATSSKKVTHKKTKKKKTHKRVASKKTKTRKRSIKTRHIRIPTRITSKKQLVYVINRIINETDPKAKVGVFIKSLETGKNLYLRNIYQPMIPASIMKVLTAEASLLYLGEDYRFSTQLLTNATDIKDGILQGDVYIILSGDPTLTYEDITELMQNLSQEGITGVSGNVYIDDTAYDKRFFNPGWGQKDRKYCYGAPIAASIINHNCLPISVKPARLTGKKAKVITSSRHYYPQIANSVITKASRTRACSLQVEKSKGKISLKGCMRKNHQGWGMQYVVSDIPEYNRSLFTSLLKSMHIKVYGSVTFGTAPERLSLIGTHESDALPELIHDMLKKSDNVIAGALFKKLGQLYTNQPGSWENGSKAVTNILAKQAGVQTKGMRLLDGSGLSAENLASPSQFMQVLLFAYYNSDTSDDLISALPISGVDGTLKHRMRNITRRVKAKTGTISGVASLAGYTSSHKKEALAFVIIANGDKSNNWRYRTMEDKITTALTRYTGSL